MNGEEFQKELDRCEDGMYAGAIADRFDVAIEQISRIAVDDRVPKSIHVVINPMLDDMIRDLSIMRNNITGCMIGKDDTPMKVAQPVKYYRCRDCANEDTGFCDGCMGPKELGSKPSNWKPKDWRICPTCGKEMKMYAPARYECFCEKCMTIYDRFGNKVKDVELKE